MACICYEVAYRGSTDNQTIEACQAGDVYFADIFRGIRAKFLARAGLVESRSRWLSGSIARPNNLAPVQSPAQVQRKTRNIAETLRSYLN